MAMPPSPREIELLDKLDEIIELAQIIQNRCSTDQPYKTILKGLKMACKELIDEPKKDDQDPSTVEMY